MGEDGIGRYNATALTWAGGSTQYQTVFRQYTTGECIFEQRFPDGVANMSTGLAGQTGNLLASAFPSFDLEAPDAASSARKGYYLWNGGGVPADEPGRGDGSGVGVWPPQHVVKESCSAVQTPVSCSLVGVLALFKASPDQTAVLSAASNFLAAAQHFGFEFVERHMDDLRIYDARTKTELRYVMLEVLEFSSSRRRMSVLVRDEATLPCFLYTIDTRQQTGMLYDEKELLHVVSGGDARDAASFENFRAFYAQADRTADERQRVRFPGAVHPANFALPVAPEPLSGAVPASVMPGLLSACFTGSPMALLPGLGLVSSGFLLMHLRRRPFPPPAATRGAARGAAAAAEGSRVRHAVGAQSRPSRYATAVHANFLPLSPLSSRRLE